MGVGGVGVYIFVCYGYGECGFGLVGLFFFILFLVRNLDFIGNLIFKMLVINLKIFKYRGLNEMYLLVRYGYRIVIFDLDNWF